MIQEPRRRQMVAAIVTIALGVVTNLATNGKYPWLWIIFGVVAAAFVILQMDWGPGPAPPLDRIADDLAVAVGEQWRAEAAIRSLQQPSPIRVHWSSADGPVAPHPNAVFGHTDPARPVRLELDVT